jgi:hypothetical protein
MVEGPGARLQCQIRNEVVFMQRFVAELSSAVEKIEFEKLWQSDPDRSAEPKVEFAFTGRRVSVIVHSDTAHQWPMASFHRTFSAAIRRLNSVCNIRWL